VNVVKGVYRARFGGLVQLVEEGILLRSLWSGTRMLPWPTIYTVSPRAYGRAGLRGRIKVLLMSGETVTLPAPLGRPTGPDPKFDQALAEIGNAIVRHGTTRHRRDEDAVPLAFRVAAAVDARESHGGLRRARIPSMVFAIIGIIGCCGAIHAFARDQPTYSAYRNAQPCTAIAAAAGTAPHAWCIVSDGVVQNGVDNASGDVTALVLGPQLSSSPDGSPMVGSQSSQEAVFRDPQPRFDGDENASGVTYTVENGSSYVATVSWTGQTFQTVDSPVPQEASDLASVAAASAWMLLWLLVIASRYRHSRRPRVIRAVKLTLFAAFIAGAATCVRVQPGSMGVGLSWTVGLGLILAAGLNALDALWFRYGRPRLKRLPSSPPWLAQR
jgi:hypothetical protein